MQSIRFGLWLCVTSLACVGTYASLLAQQTASPGQQAPEQPTFRVAIDLVTTDVIVRDRSGQFVADLTRDEFQILEDGEPQEIASLTLVHGGRAFNLQAPPPPPPQEGIILPPPRPRTEMAGRIFILFVDDLHLDFRNTPRIRDLFRRVSRNLIHEGDMFGIISTGPSSLAIDLTYDRTRLDEAINRISGSGLRPADILAAPEGAEGPAEIRYRAHVAFSTAYDMLRNLEQINDRRKALIYVSNGYDFDPFPEARSGTDQFFGRRAGLNRFMETEEGGYDPFIRRGGQFSDADLARELAELTRTANRANTSIYAIDPRGLVGGPDIDEEVSPVEWGAYVRKSQDSLRVLAEETGGIAVVNQNDFDRALKRIDAETSDYYVLGYYSSNPDPTRRTRALEITVSRDDADVWSRRAYSLRPPPPPVD